MDSLVDSSPEVIFFLGAGATIPGQNNVPIAMNQTNQIASSRKTRLTFEDVKL
jgi:hypothetical protein